MPIKTDGTVPSGSRILLIGTADVSYIADNFSINRPTAFLDQRDQYNEPSGGVLLEDFITGSATLQIASSTTPLPHLGDEFMTWLDDSNIIGTRQVFYITEVSKQEERASLKKVTINFRMEYQNTTFPPPLRGAGVEPHPKQPAKIIGLDAKGEPILAPPEES